MGKPSADEQKPHTRPTEWNESRRRGTKFPHSVPQVNEAVGWWRFQSLSGEISSVDAGEKSVEIIVVITKPGAGRRSIQTTKPELFVKTKDRT